MEEQSHAPARDWSLNISTAISDKETPVFTEPGLFSVDSDGALVLAVLNSEPHMRPDPDELLSVVDRLIERGRPPRGEA
jgi:hypothetical protein